MKNLSLIQSKSSHWSVSETISSQNTPDKKKITIVSAWFSFSDSCDGFKTTEGDEICTDLEDIQLFPAKALTPSRAQLNYASETRNFLELQEKNGETLCQNQ